MFAECQHSYSHVGNWKVLQGAYESCSLASHRKGRMAMLVSAQQA